MSGVPDPDVGQAAAGEPSTSERPSEAGTFFKRKNRANIRKRGESQDEQEVRILLPSNQSQELLARKHCIQPSPVSHSPQSLYSLLRWKPDRLRMPKRSAVALLRLALRCWKLGGSPTSA